MGQEVDEVLLRLESFLAGSQVDFEGQVQALLQLGQDLFRMESAILACMQDNEYAPMVCELPFTQMPLLTEEMPVSDTLCHALDVRSEACFRSSLEEAALRENPFVRAFEVQRYCGAPVFVGGDFFGTLAFFDRRPGGKRSAGGGATMPDEMELPGAPLYWLRLFAGLVGSELERRTNTRALLAATATLQRLSRIDPVTQLLNRRGMEEKVRRLSARHEKGGGESTVLRIELGDFRAVNNQFGSTVGDIVLGEVAHTLGTVLRPSDLLAHPERAVFYAILCDSDRANGMEVAARVLRAVREHRTVCRSGLVQLQVRGSIGCVHRDVASLQALCATFEPL